MTFPSPAHGGKLGVVIHRKAWDGSPGRAERSPTEGTPPLVPAAAGGTLPDPSRPPAQYTSGNVYPGCASSADNNIHLNRFRSGKANLIEDGQLRARPWPAADVDTNSAASSRSRWTSLSVGLGVKLAVAVVCLRDDSPKP